MANHRRWVAAWCVGAWLVAAASMKAAEPWTGTDVGRTGEAGSYTEHEGTLTLRGSGMGVHPAEGDHLYFLWTPGQDDVEIVARLASLDGGAHAEAGLMLRASDDGRGTMGAIVFGMAEADKPVRNVINLCGRDPGRRYSPAWRGIATHEAPPIWLKLVRVGDNFAVYRSGDGVFWSCVNNGSGSVLAGKGPIEAGLFVASGNAAAAATAKFDHVAIGKPKLEYRSSWIGNTFGAESTGFVSNALSSLAVGADGTCYTNTFYDESGEAGKIYRDGGIVRCYDYPYAGNNYGREGTLAADGQHLYMYCRGKGIVQTDLNGSGASARPVIFADPLSNEKGECLVRGMAVGNGELYVSDDQSQHVLVAGVSSLRQIPERSFAFSGPGPIAVDRRGDLWIVQHADVPLNNPADLKSSGLIKCFSKDGQFTGRQITDVVNPTALCIDPEQDRLLVAENGPDQNIRIYTDLAQHPRCGQTFGAAGGIYSGKHPGAISDADAGGDARFYTPNNVGVDRQGNVYVNCNAGGTDLRKYTPQGMLVWQLRGLQFIDCGDFDPGTDGRDFYVPMKHYVMDWSQTAPGAEWKYAGYLWNPWKYGMPEVGHCAEVRRMGPDHSLFMFTSDQGYCGYCRMFRIDGDTAIPCGRLVQDKGQCELWIDKNGDGKESPDEIVSGPRPGDGWFINWDVDSHGDIWTAWHTRSHPYIRRFLFKGINAHGAPTYGVGAADVEDTPYPSPFGPSLGAPNRRIRFDREHDALYLAGPNEDAADAKTYPFLLARYDRWSTGNRKAAYVIKFSTPQTDEHFLATHSTEFSYKAMDVAGDYVFVAELWGPIHVYDAATGRPVTIINPGPEVSGGTAWEDAQSGIHVFKRSNGEYVIAEENSGYRARENLYRWTPAGP